MRTFYIFYINKEFKILTKDNPYNLYKALENIYYFDKDDMYTGMNIFDQVAIPFKKEEVNDYIFNNFKDNDFYMMNKNKHKFFNKYRDEKILIKTNLTHIYLKTNMSNKYVFENININPNLFACDFQNNDYFWVDNILNFNGC